MVEVKHEPFPRCIIVVVREALMALGDEAISAHLQKNGGGAGTGGATSWDALSLYPGPGPRALDAGPLGVHAHSIPVRGLQPHLVTEMKGRKQEEGASGGAVYTPMGSVQGL